MSEEAELRCVAPSIPLLSCAVHAWMGIVKTVNDSVTDDGSEDDHQQPGKPPEAVAGDAVDTSPEGRRRGCRLCPPSLDDDAAAAGIAAERNASEAPKH